MLDINNHKVLVLFTLSLLFFTSFSQPSLSEKAEISLLTCSPGEELYSLFGHSAVRVFDPQQSIDAVFNYGTFSFDEDFYFNFTMGRLNYMLGTGTMERFVRSYQYEGRGIDEQILNLDQAQKQAVFDYLVWNAQPENKYYLYDFFYDNCSSRIRDVLYASLKDAKVTYPNLEREEKPSFRNLIDVYLIYHPWGDLGIDLGLGLPCDKVVSSSEYMFLPDELMRGFAGATVDGKPLVKETRTILEAPGLEYQWSIFHPVPLMWFFAGLILILSAVGLRMGKLWIWMDVIFLFVTGAVGLLVFFLWFISDHTATVNNFNMLWAWPTHIPALALFWNQMFRRYYWLIYGSVLSLTLITFPLLPQDLHLAVLPLIVAGIFRSFVNWRYSRPQSVAS